MEIKVEIHGSLEDIKSKLKNFFKELKSQKADIGIFSEDNERKKSTKGNAEIGYYHEFGVEKTHLPQRSWLRKPAYDGTAEKEINNIELKDYFKIPSYLIVDLAEAYLESIKKEFLNWGYGWKDLAKETWARKGNENILRETEQMYKSISWRYKKK